MTTINGTGGADRIRTLAAGGSNNGLPDASAGGNDVIFGGDGADTIETGFGFNIVFAFNSADIPAEYRRHLDAVGALMQQEPSISLLIEGHSAVALSNWRTARLAPVAGRSSPVRKR